PEEASVARHDEADEVIVYMEKSMHLGCHLDHSVSIKDERNEMGCVVKLEKEGLFIGSFGEYSFMEGACWMKMVVIVPSKVEVERRMGLLGRPRRRSGSEPQPSFINPTRSDPKPALTKTREGRSECWLAPKVEDGWHEIPAVADRERRASQ